MKYVIIVSSLKMGGAERVAVSLSNWLAKENQVYLISLDNSKPLYAVDQRVNLYINDGKSYSKNFFKRYIQRYKYVKKILDIANPTVVFSIFYRDALIPIIYKLRNKKISVISSERGNPRSKDRKGFTSIIYKLIVNGCDGFILQTNAIKKYYSKRVQRKSIVIYNPVSNPVIEELNYFNYNERDNLITSMGRIEYQKAHDVMIKAFSIIANEFPEYKLMIFGDGKDKDKMINLISELGLQSKIKIMGNDKNAISYVAKSKLFLLTSRYEGMPNALIEAMACGVPCISSNCNYGPSEIIKDDYNGLLYEVDNVSELVEKIKKVLSNEKFAEDLSKRAMEIKKSHSMEKCFGDYKNFFDSFYKENI